jgi:hypothetical protein
MPELSRITPGNRRRSGTVRAIAREQEGIVARAQLLAAGVSASAIDRALRSGALHRVHLGVYAAVAPELLTEDGHLIAALLAAGEGALLSHGTAAWRWRIIPAPPSVMQLAVPRAREGLHGVMLVEGRRLHHAPGHGEMKSRLERRFRTLLIRRGIELPLRNEPVGPWTVDCLWRDRCVAVEFDGRHTSARARPTQTTTAISGFAATATSRAATASARSTTAPTT